MAEEICIRLPEELSKEFKSLTNIDKSVLVTRLLMEKLKKHEKLKKIVSKSKLSEKSAEEISDEINKSLYKRYKSL